MSDGIESKRKKDLIGELVSPKLLSVELDSTLKEAAEIMRNDGVGSLLVHDQDKAVGMITDRDMVVRCLARGDDPRSARVGDCMTHGVVTCGEETPIDAAAKLMREQNVRRLVVCDENDNPVGIVSVDDLAFHIQDDHLYHELMRGVSHTGRAA